MHIGTTAQSPNGTIDVAVLISGTPQPLYRRSDGKIFVAGVPGCAYTLRVHNLTAGGIEVLGSVDQRDITEDRPADIHATGGYLLAAYETQEFPGWRVSDRETRDFVFTFPSASVAAQATGSAEGVGVIGFAAYREYRRQPSYLSVRRVGAIAQAAAPAGGAMNVIEDSAPAERDLGTGIGQAREHRVRRVHFTREPGEPDLLEIGYATEASLRSQGILGPREPEAFPGRNTGYEKYKPAN